MCCSWIACLLHSRILGDHEIAFVQERQSFSFLGYETNSVIGSDRLMDSTDMREIKLFEFVDSPYCRLCLCCLNQWSSGTLMSGSLKCIHLFTCVLIQHYSWLYSMFLSGFGQYNQCEQYTVLCI